MKITLQLEKDNNIIYRLATAGESIVIIIKFRLWVPKIVFNGAGMKLYAENYLKPKTWSYLREFHEKKQTRTVNDYFRISTGINRPRHVFIWITNLAKLNVQTQNV